MGREELQEMRMAVDLELSRLNKRLSPAQRYTADDVGEIVEMVVEDMISEGMTVRNFLAAVAEYRRRESWMPTSAKLLELHRDISARIPDATQREALPSGSQVSEHMLAVLRLSKTYRERGMDPIAAHGRAMREVKEAADKARRETFIEGGSWVEMSEMESAAVRSAAESGGCI